MPQYVYSCQTCNSIFERLLKMSQMEEPISQPCPDCGSQGNINQEITSASFGDPIKLGFKRPDAGWSDVLSKVKAAHPKGNWSNQKFSPIAGR